MGDKVTVYIRNLNKKIEAGYNDILGIVLAKNNLLPLPCGGRGFCGQCIVRVRGRVSEPTGNELSRGLGGELRLACQTRILGDIEVELFHRPVFNVSHISYNITLRKIEPIYEVSDIVSDNLPLAFPNEVIIAQVKDNCLSRGNKVISLFGHPISIVDIREDDKHTVLMMDIGTTKIAYQIVDESGNVLSEKTILNPLIRYGTDIISRLSKIMEYPEGMVEMRDLLVKTIKDVSEDREDTILMALAGNTVNQSIVLGLPVDKLAVKPYQPYFKGPFIGVIDNCIPFYAAPFVGGFVGGDAFSNIAAIEYMNIGKPYLIIDIGTNTEVIVGTGRDEDPIYVTSTPAGPAFEGHIESGAGVGLPGISRVRVRDVYNNNILFEYVVEGGEKPAGLLGSGTISLLAELLRNKIIDNRGRIIKGYDRINGVKTLTIVGSDKTITSKPIVFTQLDVRELQKAIAAVKTSWQLLLQKSGIKISDLKWIVLTGTFGSAIDINDAFTIGLIPRISRSKVIVAGNMVLSGLKTLVFDVEHENKMRSLLHRSISIDLAETKEFTDLWIRNLEFGTLEDIS